MMGGSKTTRTKKRWLSNCGSKPRRGTAAPWTAYGLGVAEEWAGACAKIAVPAGRLESRISGGIAALPGAVW